MIDEDRNPWTLLGSEVRYENPWIRVTHHEVRHPTGAAGVYGVVHYKNLAVGVVPVDSDGWTWLVGQYRLPLETYSWEMPEGGSPVGQDPEQGARRELAEETGLIAGRLREILRMDLSNSVCDERAICYVAWDLRPGPSAPEPSEELQIRRASLGEVLERVKRGDITDAMTVATILRLKLLSEEGGLPADLQQALERGFADG
jgi:8-oxo-dGTP pyrophosphatase MutT (NUDIX family)